MLYLATVGLLAPAHSQTLQYYLPFDDGKYATLKNAGTKGGEATINSFGSGSPIASTYVPPNLGRANSELFAGNGSLTLPDSNNLFVLNGGCMTLSTWVYIKDLSQGSGIANKSNDAATPGWVVWVTSNGLVHYQWTTSGQVASNATTTPVPAGKWFHLAVVSGNNVGDVKFYVDGMPQARLNPYAGTGLLDVSSFPIVVGASGTTSGSANGNLCDFAMWDGMLGPGEITALYTTPTLIPGYNAGVMDQLFKAYASKSSVTINDVTWSYAGQIHAGSHQLGDAWLDGDTYNIWLESGDQGRVSGMSATKPFKL